jgi:hypothetical protein
MSNQTTGEKPTIDEIAGGLRKVLEDNAEFLETLRKIGSKNYNEETERKIELDIQSQLATVSGYFVMLHFLRERGLTEEYGKYRAEVFKRVDGVLSEEEKAMKKEIEG